MTIRITRRTAFGLAAGAIASPLVAREGFAQAYPNRPVTVIVPFGAGGSTDVIGRIVGERLQQRLGQGFIIENRAGAGGNVGVAALARSANDGYTIGMTTISNHGINPILYRERLPFKPIEDFEFLSLSSAQPNFMCIHPSIPAKTLPEFIAYLKANPGKENFGSSGIGTSIHLSAELFMQLTGTKLIHVPMRSSAALVQALINGEVKLSFDNFTSPYPHYKAGSIRGLAVTSAQRAKIAPEIPPLAETLPGFDITSWNGFLAPKGTPKEICDRLTQALRDSLSEPSVVSRFEEMGAASTPSTPDEFKAKSLSEMAKFDEIITKAGITLQN
ncbi:Bug family tripartite tricarboxylate transporter substrate binding protein [Phreatobacter stygius]|uniref:Tripartite tricarboxylate transporter substrate binding protein n=1 Tax=Phreatobacter stygius TaxID=1940610 RepID=A0A4D7B6M3_9HYPH|nr:tripartite tricarboxylate transporter substrate binding protein [Phreatobacter stygius]QCI66725.1 tripartite tricarboxylate transporter substrate binding protein [Phreatobacter stygius]